MSTRHGIAPKAAGVKRRLLSLLYESLLLAAVLLAGALPMVMLASGWEHTAARAALQIWLLALCAGFYVWQWTGAGQTLPMKTWKMRLVSNDGSAVSARRALLRYAGALLSTATLGLGFAWALVDRDRQFLHDRLAGTRLVIAADKP